MKLRFHRLREMVPGLSATPTEAANRLTLAGVAVERVHDAEGDPVLETEITTNRPDLLCYAGVARELATLYGLRLVLPTPKFTQTSSIHPDLIPVRILAEDGCSRYSARIVRGVKVGPSPEWLRHELEAVGMRAISNVVDVTNYVLLEFGHPLHAFDLAKLGGPAVVVRRANAGESMRSLDSVDRKLDTSDLVIADSHHAVALAGVIGGAESEVSHATRDILIESAWFEPATIRRTARRYSLRTEASIRFERGADWNGTVSALDRAAQLIQQLAGGEIADGMVDVIAKTPNPTVIRMRLGRLERILGTPVLEARSAQILGGLGFEPRPEVGVWTVTCPSFRGDVSREIDLIEEIGRHYGYDQVVSKLPLTGLRPRGRTREQERLKSAREILRGAGFSEAITLSMVDAVREKALNPNRAPLGILNPLSDRMAVLRTSAFSGLLESIDHNLRHGQGLIPLYEIASVFADGSDEERHLGVVVPTTDAAGAAEAALRVKGLVASLGQALRLEPLVVDRPTLPATIRFGAIACGHILLVRPEQLAAANIESPFWAIAAEIHLTPLLNYDPGPIRFRGFSRFPDSTRDLSLWSGAVTYGELEHCIRAVASRLLALVEFVERYTEPSTGRTSLMLRLTYRHPDRTLESDEVQAEHDHILTTLAADSRLSLRV